MKLKLCQRQLSAAVSESVYFLCKPIGVALIYADTTIHIPPAKACPRLLIRHAR